MSLAKARRVYTGIGSRRTPRAVLPLLVGIAEALARDGWTLRTGGAEGADRAFLAGCSLGRGTNENFLPWPGFDGWHSPFSRPHPAAYRIAERLHPNWYRCGVPAQILLARDVHEVLGWNLDTPSTFVLCWTVDGATTPAECSLRTGGTHMAIRVAAEARVPVYNLARPGHLAWARANAQKCFSEVYR